MVRESPSKTVWRRTAAWCTASCLAFVLTAASRLWAQTVEVPTFWVGYPGSLASVAAGSDGAITFVWSDENSGPPSTYAGYTRQFASDGTPLSDPIRIDVGGHFEWPDIATLPGGGYVVASLYHNANNSHHVLGRFLDASAMPSGAPFQVEVTSTKLYSKSVAALPTGPVFFWHQANVWSRRFDSFGVALEAPVVVDDTDTGDYGVIQDMAALPGGGYVVVWFNSAYQSSRGRIFAANGAPIGPYFSLGSLVVRSVAASAAGGIAVGGWSNTQVLVQRFSLDGLPIGSPIMLFDQGVSFIPTIDLEFDPFGNLYVVWSSYTSGLGILPVQARVVDSSGNLTGPPVELAPEGGNYIRTARLANGRFVNVWSGISSAYANIVSVCGLGSTTCGDGTVDPPCEQCDDGAANSDTQPDACRTSCKTASCGDHVVDSGEECDDGNRVGGDGCDQNCRTEVCGNARIEGGEECDDGNLVDTDGCDSNCKVTRCGNGVLTAGEECDDGNTANGDGCDQNCLIEVCGNSRIEGGEECDDGNSVDGDSCDSNCTNTRCGNSILTPPEECDDGNNSNDDGCDRTCLVEQCGDSRVEGDEACDDGNLVDGDGCESNCTLTRRIDSMVDVARPVKVSVPSAGSATKTVDVNVRNVDAEGLQILRLTADHGTCPVDAIAIGPDFNLALAGEQDTVALLPKQKARARVTLQFSRGSFLALDRKVPYRCTINLAVGPAALGAVDGAPANNTAVVTVDVVDRAAPNGSAAEFYIRPLRPLKLHIAKDVIAAQRSVPVQVRTAQAGGKTFNFQANDGDCPPGTVTIITQDPAGAAVVSVRASRAFFTTPNSRSPARCTATVTAASEADTDAGNNTTTLTLDVRDDNDSP